MKIAYFTKYSRKGASSRLRSFQYFPYIEEKGIEVQVYPLFKDNYLNAIYTNKTPYFQIVTSYCRRFIDLFGVFKYDKIIIEKELFPYFPPVIEWILNRCGVKYNVDYDDAIFHNYDLNSNKWIRRLFSGKIDSVMRNSHWVIAGNNYISARAHSAGSKNVEIIPTVIDFSRYEKKLFIKKQPIVIGWIGSPTTFRYLLPLKETFIKLSCKYDIKVHIVGASQFLGIGNIEKQIPWEEKEEVNEIKKFDIGIMPLADSPWEKGKCSYKLIQYMACGVPVVASPVGTNLEVVEDNSNGFLANDKIEWYQKLEQYILSPALREKHGNYGYQMVQEKYNIEAVLAKLITILRDNGGK